eukprot:scaffold4931_cov79-Skeletonema_dohrnii-CCMP3373.AAC.1
MAVSQPPFWLLPASHSVVEDHMPLLHELIIFPKGKFTHHLLAKANNHVAGSTRPARPGPAAILPPPSIVFTRANCRRT